MPIDPNIRQMMLAPLQNMINELENRKYEGEHLSVMKSMLKAANEMADNMDDASAFSIKMAQDNLYSEFGELYAKAMNEACTVNQNTGESGQNDLLSMTVSQYENSLKQLEGNPDNVHLLPPLKRAIEIGKSGVSYPVFLKMCEEEGLFEEMNSGKPRPVIEYFIHVATEMFDPLRLEMYQKQLAVLDKLEAESFYGNVDSFLFGLEREKLEHEYAPLLNKRQYIIRSWDRLFDIINDWIDAHCSFAPYDQRWAADNMIETLRNIKRCKECYPGFLKVREKIMKESAGMCWDDIFEHETFKNEMAACRIYYHQDKVRLISEAHAIMIAGEKCPTHIISEVEKLHKEGKLLSPEYLEKWGKEKGGYKFTAFSEFAGKYA